MKNTFSVLFFCLLFASGVSIVSNKLYAQTIADSSAYYVGLAMNPKEDTDLVSAYNFFLKHKVSCLNKKKLEGAVYDLNMLSIIQKQFGFLHDSEASAIEAISLLEQIEDSEYSRATKVSLYNELGKICRALLEDDRALMYYAKALEIATEPHQVDIILNNRAFIYMDKQAYDSALSEFQKAYDISVKIKDTKEIARNLDNIGYTKSKLNQPDALSNMESALEQRLKLKDVEGAYASYKHLFDYYKDRDDQPNALINLNRALALANDLNSDAYRLDALSDYMAIDDDSLVRTYKVLNDKITTENLVNENKYASRKYDYTTKELEAERNKIQKQGYQMLGGFLVVLAILSYFLLKSKHKKDNIQQVFNTETRISKRIHDELANDMSDLMSYVENDIETSPPHKAKLLTTLQDVYIRTRDISTETASIDFVNFPESLRYLLIQHNKPNVKIIVNDINTIEWKTVSHHKKLAVYRGLQELMVNMKKHSDAHLVSVVFKKQKNKNEIWYTDDGKGCSLDDIKQSGLSNAEFRIKEIGGKLTFETSQGNGFKAIITFYS